MGNSNIKHKKGRKAHRIKSASSHLSAMVQDRSVSIGAPLNLEQEELLQRGKIVLWEKRRVPFEIDEHDFADVPFAAEGGRLAVDVVMEAIEIYNSDTVLAWEQRLQDDGGHYVLFCNASKIPKFKSE